MIDESMPSRFDTDGLLSHTWRLPPLGGSKSEAALPVTPHSFSNAKRRSRHIGLSHTDKFSGRSDAAPTRQTGHTAKSAAISSAMIDMELRLREVLMKEPPWPPSRTRVQASIDALHELSRASTSLSAFLPLLATELTNAVQSGNVRAEPAGLPRHSKPFYFELVEALREDVRQHQQDVDAMHVQLTRAHQQQSATEAKLLQVQQQLNTCRQELEARKSLEEQHAAQMGKATRQYELLLEERDVIDDRLAHTEEVVRQKDEKVKEAEVYCISLWDPLTQM